MTLYEIMHAVESGQTVCYKDDNHLVLKNGREFNILSVDTGHRTGLVWMDGETLNGDESEFFIKDPEPHCEGDEFVIKVERNSLVTGAVEFVVGFDMFEITYSAEVDISKEDMELRSISAKAFVNKQLIEVDGINGVIAKAITDSIRNYTVAPHYVSKTLYGWLKTPDVMASMKSQLKGGVGSD